MSLPILHNATTITDGRILYSDRLKQRRWVPSTADALRTCVVL